MSLAVIDQPWRRRLPADGQAWFFCQISISAGRGKERSGDQQHTAAVHTQGHLPPSVLWKSKIKGQNRKWMMCTFLSEVEKMLSSVSTASCRHQ